MAICKEKERILNSARSALAQATQILQDLHTEIAEEDLQMVISAATQARQAAQDLDILNGMIRATRITHALKSEE